MIRTGKTAAQPTKASNNVSKQEATCNYEPRICNQPVLENYDYCFKHILEDKNAPYKPCGYAYPSNNKRCLLPAPRGDKRDIGYCTLHVWKAQMKRQRSIAKHVPPATPESLLSGLSHYVRPIRSTLKIDGDDYNNTTRTRPINLFVEADVTKASAYRSHVLECASESDSDVETATLDNIWTGENEDSSDAESIDSQMDDPLKHASYFTAEEAVVMTRNKLLRLQVLYQKQFDRLTHLLREKRRKYLHALRKEKETYSSIYDQPRTSAKEIKLYEKLKALNRYHKRSTAESAAYFAMLEKKMKQDLGPNYVKSSMPGSVQKCAFTEGGVRCSRATIPLTRHCLKHMLEDSNQCLFRACGCTKGGNVCQDTVTGLCTGETCVLHIKLSNLPHSNFPESFNKLDMEDKMNKSMDDSELDASATESAFSTDNRDSPDDSMNTTEDVNKQHSESLMFTSMKSDFPEECEQEVSENSHTHPTEEGELSNRDVRDQAEMFSVSDVNQPHKTSI
ncbi:KAT8 regulatory NSL complex subunit 2 isoform X1 [Cimex lectularius]|uniref:KAT8 regulatory NSL complex subunit 2 n=2 Tax=Cimex lectularius TaxID=79782 RepID=A0A8I6RRI0_CIMLE|nr:KAT8 regulatory NSL complex subunit 2 isoform X1 [Cimex lectularius]